ncbi:DUF6927 domain-containing protein [Sphingomonas sp. SUN039]|uniref:DUF6927 domain-containing protein n=1 Tax=Sphingomonas sp. SUN039 TaxID=2937787 RepID=UPI0021647919|nr:hypothetical protein [Sphingomonas sp. SUN039]UVO53731.1 hypothetical protein M0209_06200 [Sphingomonas sp. SUN039]
MTREHMGSTTTPKAYLDAAFTHERAQDDGSTRGLRVLRSAYVDRVYYAAVQSFVHRDGTEATEPVFAIVCLTRWTPNARDGHVFGYKDMSEHAGPCETGCPEAILAMLGPTSSDYARAWRQRCRATIGRRKRAISDGDRIKFAAPMRFTDGHEGDEFTVRRVGRRLTLIAPHGGHYRVTRLRDRDWSIIPQTRVHAPVFGARD